MKFLICGAGHSGKNLHASAITSLNQEIIGFVDPILSIGTSAAREYETKYFPSIANAILSNKIDVVVIASASSTHLTVLEEALKSGIRKFIIEKPIVENLEELKRLKELRSKFSASICAVHNHRFYSSYITARKRLNLLGEIISIRRVMSFNSSEVRMMEKNHWSHKIPGGRLFEANPHNIYLLYSLIGEFKIDNISGIEHRERSYSPLQSFTCTGKSSKNALVNIEMSMSFNNPNIKKLNRTEIFGSKKMMIVNNNSLYEGTSFDSLKKQNLSRPSYLPRNPLKKRRYNIKSSGSGHLNFYHKYINSKDQSFEPVSFQEAYFTQVNNNSIARLIDN